MTNDLKFSGDLPVVINYNGSTDDIYAPVRTSSCDINIVSSKILDDLYTAKKNDICVRIKKGNTTIWEGYKMPNTYSQEVSLNLDNITMTAIDPVSILKFVTIDKILDKPNIMTYRTIIGKALAYVMIDANSLWVERTVSYDGTYSGSNGLLDLSVQVANFWDELNEPSTVYEVIEEMLRPFCLTLVYYDNSYQIYNPNKTTGTRHFDKYTINANGTLTSTATNVEEVKASGLYEFANDAWKSNNTQTPTIEIGSTYEKVTGVASTSIPEYSRMAMDLIDYTQRDLYETGQLNVQRNKTKGYVTVPTPQQHYELDSSNRWYYIWNGVYTNTAYNLYVMEGNQMLDAAWYLNANKMLYYRDGSTGHPNGHGSVLNFYGGANNPTGTGKTQSTEKSVSIDKRITAFAEDNGVPPELLELSDLAWSFDSHLITGDEGQGEYQMDPDITKTNPTNSKFGAAKQMQQSTRVSYRQEYTIHMEEENTNVIKLDLSHSYSRTGVDMDIDILQNNTYSNGLFDAQQIVGDSGEGEEPNAGKRVPYIMTCNINYFPELWDASTVKVNTVYFDRYRTTPTLLRPARCREVWDKRRIYLYITMPDNSVMQFNGKTWVSDLHPENANSFYLMKLMNGEQLFHNNMRYNVIETADGERYSLTDEQFTYITDEAGGVCETEVSGSSTHYLDVYRDESKDWYKWLDNCSEGNLSIKLPSLNMVNASVICEVFNSTLLGSTGNDTTLPGPFTELVKYKVEGTGRYYDDSLERYVTFTMNNSNVVDYGIVKALTTTVKFLPYNVTYVKAEHLNLDISVTVPESNLGQMFNESDIKYELNSDNDYVEEFEGPSFLVNSYNPLVASSFSYLVFGNTVADPNLFIVNSRSGRPEAYTVQAYFNWLSKIRKIYTKTLIPYPNYVRTRPFSNVRCYLKSPEVGTNELLVVKDSWDVKTDRHTVTAVEDQDLEVGTVGTVDVIEIPRMARADRYNLPTAKKK